MVVFSAAFSTPYPSLKEFGSPPHPSSFSSSWQGLHGNLETRVWKFGGTKFAWGFPGDAGH